MRRRLLIAAALVAVVVTATIGAAATLGVNAGALTSFQLPGMTGPVMTGLVMQDQNFDGFVDMVIVDFSGSVAATNAADWTLANVPSGGSVSGVTFSGSQVFVTLAPGTGDPDTSVGGFTISFDDSTGALTSFGPVAPGDAAAPVPVRISSTNVAGGTLGQMQAGDSLDITFSEPIVGVPAAVAVTQTDDGASADYLSIPGVTAGPVSLGSTDYLHARGKSATFASSAASVAGSVLRVTVGGTCSANPQSDCDKLKPGQGAFTYVSAPTLADAAGNPAAGSFTTAATFRLF